MSSLKKGWAEILKSAWQENTGRARYRYTWNFNPDGSEGVVFMADKIHKNHDYKWVNPVHEILMPIDERQLETIDLPNVRLYHKADNTKSRGSYLPLLELSVEEDPTNDRNMHYLGREYMFYGKYEKAIETLKRHLELPNATWADERAASYRFIGFSYKKLAKDFLLCYNKHRKVIIFAMLAQLDRASVYGRYGLGFDFSHKKEVKKLNMRR